MTTKRRCIVLPVETDDQFSVRGLITEGYVRVQIGRNDFFVPANTFKRAFFALEHDSMEVGDRQNGDPVSFQRVEDDGDGERNIRFTVRTSSGDIRHTTLPFFVMKEIVERIDQTKALLHSYPGIEEATLSLDANTDVCRNNRSDIAAS